MEEVAATASKGLPAQEVAATASKGLPARLEGDGPVRGLLARSRHAYPMDPRRSWLRKPLAAGRQLR